MQKDTSLFGTCCSECLWNTSLFATGAPVTKQKSLELITDLMLCTISEVRWVRDTVGSKLYTFKKGVNDHLPQNQAITETSKMAQKVDSSGEW